jgi:hypothetical protein
MLFKRKTDFLFVSVIAIFPAFFLHHAFVFVRVYVLVSVVVCVLFCFVLFVCLFVCFCDTRAWVLGNRYPWFFACDSMTYISLA